MQAEIETDGLKDQSFDSDQMRSMCFLSLVFERTPLACQSSKLDNTLEIDTHGLIPFALTTSTIHHIRNLITRNLYLPQLFQRVFQFRCD